MKTKSSTIRQLIILFGSTCVFFFVSFPFTRFTDFFHVTEVRVSAVLNPCIGFVFGPVGALGCALGNLICDIITIDVGTALGGLVPQFIYGLVPWLFLCIYRIPKEEKKYYRFIGIKSVLLFYLAVVAACLFIAACIGIFFASGHERVNLFLFLLANNISMNFVFAIPLVQLLVYLKGKLYRVPKGRRVSIGETLLVFFMLVECVGIVLVGIVSYLQLRSHLQGVALWNGVFYSTVFAVLVFSVLQVFFMVFIEKKILEPISLLASVWQKDRKLAVETCNSLYHNPSEIGDLSRTYLELVDEIQVNIMKLSRTKVYNNGVGDITIVGKCAMMTFSGSLENTDAEDLAVNLAQIPPDCSMLEINTEGVTFMTGEILRTLSEFIEKRGGFRVVMTHVNESTKMILNITGFSDLIEIS